MSIKTVIYTMAGNFQKLAYRHDGEKEDIYVLDIYEYGRQSQKRIY